MKKITLGEVPLVVPVPIVLVGSYVDGRANFAEVGDVAIAGIKPALVMVSLAENHHTMCGIRAAKVFSVNIPSTTMLDRVDACGMVSGRVADKSAWFDVVDSGRLDVPLIRECPVNLACELLREVQVEHRCVLVAKVVECQVDEMLLEDDGGRRAIKDLQAFDPILYGLDNRYYRIGDPIGEGYNEGGKICANPVG
ncbi:flavin reductase family protein [Candidatus Bipolaricaulota bacterium]|nr:flavin reductase family protein [Candidatus Bipolaricaulota bacterium]